MTTTIRHICAGHEYRYNTETGDVKNNYGTHVASLRFCKFTGIALLYRVGSQWPAMHSDDLLASHREPMTDARRAEWAIGQTAANCPALA